MLIDITKEVEYGENDGEYLPLIKCKCGHKFDNWDFILTIYEEDFKICPNCKRKLFFKNLITIYEVL